MAYCEIVFAASLADLYGRAVSAKERAGYEARLIEANQTLEQKVEERTAELAATLKNWKRLRTNWWNQKRWRHWETWLQELLMR